MRHPRPVISKGPIRDRVWSDDFGGGDNIVELHISHLRKNTDAWREPMIHTIRGSGCVLCPPG